MQAVELQQLLAENVRARRAALGMTQQQLADAAGIQQPNVASIEAGDVSIRLAKLAALADALDTTPADLLTKQKSRSKIPA